jgi:hypothetical protein
MIRFRYEPFRPGQAVIVVGGAPAGALHLSSWPGNATPPELRAPTSSEIVLKFLGLKTARREVLRRGAEVVTAAHFGVDALLALWALCHPHRAQGFTGPLQAAAYSGAYEVFVLPEATKICCAIHRLADPERSPPRAELTGADAEGQAIARFHALLPRVDDLLGYPDRFVAEWREEFETIQADRARLTAGAAAVEEFPEVDLAVVRTPRPLHPMARNSATDRLRVLTITGEATYDLAYRAESWADRPDRAALPRVDLAPLRPELQALEPAGTWRWDGIAFPTPRLRCEDPAGRSIPSAIPPDRFLALLLAFLARHG